MSALLDELLRRSHTGQLHTSMDEDRIANPPATGAQIEAAETRLGFALPPLLRRIYSEIGNGGFGPGYGLFPLSGRADDPSGHDGYGVVDLYFSFRYRYSPLGQRWAERLLPICHWGCSYFSYLDCAVPLTPVISLAEDNHGDGPWGCAINLHAQSFEDWMRRWLDGEDLWQSFGAHGEPIFYKEEYADDDAPVRLSRSYSVAPEALFEAWLTPSLARRWLFIGPDAELVHAEVDARVGGRYSICVNQAGKEIEYSGAYETIERPGRLAFSLQAGALLQGTSRVSVEVTPIPGGSRLDLTHTGLPGRVVGGPWNHMLDALGRVLTDRRSKA